MATLTVEATGDIDSNWTPSTGTDRYAMVADSNDGTTIASSTNNQQQFFSYASIAGSIAAGSTINSVQVVVRAQNATDGDVQVRVFVGGGAAGNGATTALSTTLTTYSGASTVFTTNPDTTAAWTRDQVVNAAGASNLTGFGVRAVNVTSGTVTVAKAYMVIDYTEPAGSGSGHLLLLGVG
jgi:hypothetical protein